MSHRRALAALALCALAVGACSDATAPERSSELELSRDIALATGAAATSNLAVLRGDMARAGLPGALRPGMAAVGPVSESCTLDEETTTWHCARTSEIGVQVERWITLFADQAPVAGYDAATTDSIRVRTVLTGEIVGDGRRFSVNHEHDVTVSGLEGAETQRTVSGTGAREEHAELVGERGTRTYDGTSSTLLDAIVFPVGGGHPLSGRLVHEIDATMTMSGAREGSRTVSRRVEIAFNGTATVPLTVGTLACTLNLETGRVACGR